MPPPVPSVSDLFAAALAVPPAERDRFLSARCPDPGVRREVAELLALDERAETEHFLSGTAPGATHGAPGVGAVVGAYRLRERIGAGSGGTVYRAERVADYRHEVAVKVGPSGLGGETALDRFRAERDTLAALDHPNVARILDGGATADGRPYFVMELVRGDRIDRYADAQKLNARQRAALFAGAVAGVACAHARGIVHRDLKPGNVLVSDTGVAKVVDFGLAARAALDGPTLTRTGDILGTPGYLAPEQADGRAADATPATDVFALGATLYALLTGRAPFRADTAWESVRQALEDEPVRPSRLAPGLPRDLESICLKCLEKAPHRRYASAAELLADLERFARGESVLARPITRAVRAARWARRHPLPAGLLALLFVVVASSVTSIVVLWRNAEASAERAKLSATAAEDRNKIAREALKAYTEAANGLFRVPDGVSAAQRDALTRALELYQQVLAEAEGGDPDEEDAAAYTTLRLADSMHRIRQFAPAERACRIAVAAQERLVARYPDNREYAVHYAEGLTQLASALEALGRGDEALARRRTAIRVCEPLARSRPGRTGARAALAAFRSALADILAHRGATEEAVAMFAEAATELRELIDMDPGFSPRYESYGYAQEARARCLLRLGDERGARAHLEEMMELAERTRRARPADWYKLVPQLTVGYAVAADVLVRAARPAEARDVLLRGCDLLGELTRLAPNDTVSVCAHARHLYEAALLSAPDDPHRAVRFRAAIGVLDTARRVSPAASIDAYLVEFLAGCPDPAVRDPKRALELARERARLYPQAGAAWASLGHARLATGDSAGAVAELSAGLATATGQTVGPRSQLALARWQAGDREVARADLRNCAEQIRSNPVVGVVYLHTFVVAWRTVFGTEPPDVKAGPPR